MTAFPRMAFPERTVAVAPAPDHGEGSRVHGRPAVQRLSTVGKGTRSVGTPLLSAITATANATNNAVSAIAFLLLFFYFIFIFN